MAKTPFLGLETIDFIGTDAKAKLASGFLALAGIAPDSNMNKIDEAMRLQKVVIDKLGDKQGIIPSNAVLSTSGDIDFYSVENKDIKEYKDKMLLLLSFSETNKFKIQLSINDLGFIDVKKINKNSEFVPVDSGDFVKNVYYLFLLQLDENNPTKRELILVGEDVNGKLKDLLDLINEELKLKAPLNSPTFTGIVGGITQDMIGLGNVDNTADMDKPISTAQNVVIKTVKDNLNNHKESKTNPHNVIKEQIGLANVTNDAQVKRSEMGIANGVATLDDSGVVPSDLLPSFVDNVLEYNLKSELPKKGESGKIYIVYSDIKKNNGSYRWSGSTYVLISNLIDIATEQEALKGVDDTKMMTPKKVKLITDKKVDQVDGKSLSTNDYKNEDKKKLADLHNYDDSEVKKNLKLKQDKPATNNTAYGVISLSSNTTGEYNTAVGSTSLWKNTTGDNNTAVGYSALWQNTEGKRNNAIGCQSLSSNTTGNYNNAIGYFSLSSNINGRSNSAFGDKALYNNTEGNNNSAFGDTTLTNNTTGCNNTAIGYSSLSFNTTGCNNTAIGFFALWKNQDGSEFKTFQNCSGIGQKSAVSGSNQVQLGDSSTTTYAYGAIQNRSDRRDKTDIQDTSLGLEFISKINPVEFKWDYREDYDEEVNVIESLNPAITLDDGTIINNYIKSKALKLPKNGSEKRKRFHQGFIAQEVKQVMDNLDVDFGGYQDHSINGGCDVLSLGYEEFIPPIVKAIQEQQKMIEDLKNQISDLKFNN